MQLPNHRNRNGVCVPASVTGYSYRARGRAKIENCWAGTRFTPAVIPVATASSGMLLAAREKFSDPVRVSNFMALVLRHDTGAIRFDNAPRSNLSRETPKG